jgi:aryl-alcohol dehydrogenase-like predicted oxidoreductase
MATMPRQSDCSPISTLRLQMQALHDVVQKGWVRYIGMSSCWAWQCIPFQTRVVPYAHQDPPSSPPDAE